MTTKQTPEQYLKKVYGLEPSDLNLVAGSFDTEEVERLAVKYNLTSKDQMSIEKATAILDQFTMKKGTKVTAKCSAEVAKLFGIDPNAIYTLLSKPFFYNGEFHIKTDKGEFPQVFFFALP